MSVYQEVVMSVGWLYSGWKVTAVVGVCAAVGWCGAMVASADAAQVNLCVPTAAGGAVTSNGSGTSCASGKMAVALPSSAAAQATLIAVLPHLSFSSSGVDGKPTIRITGVNVQLEDGAGSTAAVNGEGNLVLGYDQSPGPGGQSGSHNVVLGSGQAYTSYGSIIGGSDNFDAGHDSTVLGYGNAVTGPYASITGGRLGTASGSMSSVQGGYSNQASAAYASVAGGCDNLAGTGSVDSIPSACGAARSFGQVAGGEGNQASANNATVAGGDQNSASGPDSSITGGNNNSASFEESSVTGGDENSASGPESSVTGGVGNSASFEESSVTGGLSNSASGDQSSVTGGVGNSASGFESSVTGGEHNAASAGLSSISGGESNASTAFGAFVASGCDNLAGPGSLSTATCDEGAGSDGAILGGHQISLATTDGTYPAGP
jgi:hypothetical protein